MHDADVCDVRLDGCVADLVDQNKARTASSSEYHRVWRKRRWKIVSYQHDCRSAYHPDFK